MPGSIFPWQIFCPGEAAERSQRSRVEGGYKWNESFMSASWYLLMEKEMQKYIYGSFKLYKLSYFILMCHKKIKSKSKLRYYSRSTLVILSNRSWIYFSFFPFFHSYFYFSRITVTFLCSFVAVSMQFPCVFYFSARKLLWHLMFTFAHWDLISTNNYWKSRVNSAIMSLSLADKWRN